MINKNNNAKKIIYLPWSITHTKHHPLPLTPSLGRGIKKDLEAPLAGGYLIEGA